MTLIIVSHLMTVHTAHRGGIKKEGQWKIGKQRYNIKKDEKARQRRDEKTRGAGMTLHSAITI